MNEKHSRLRELFAAACDLPESEQAKFIDSNCANPELRLELINLLRSDRAESGFFPDGNTATGINLHFETVFDHGMPEPPDRDDRYQLMGEIARGGMGAILEGRDTELGRDLAIKVLLDEHKNNPEIVQRFLDEAQIGGQLQHPGIAPVYEVGQFADRRPYISMKLVKGETLAALLAKRKNPSDERGKFLGIFEQVCQTVAYAHSRGVIHRDLKPANIMVGAFGEVQVMDWGLAKVLSRNVVAKSVMENIVRSNDDAMPDSSVQTNRNRNESRNPGSPTRAGSVMGTPAYMPPEQALGIIEKIDQRTDVFSLGAILNEILTGHPVYSGHSNQEVVELASAGLLSSCFERLSATDADPELVAIAKECLQPDQNDRPEGAAALSDRITGYLESVENRLHLAELDRAAQTARAVEERKRRRVTFVLAGTILLTAILGSTGWMILQNQRAKDVAETETRINKSLDDARLHQRLADSATAESDPTMEARVRELNQSLVFAKDALKLTGSNSVDESLITSTREFVSDLEQLTISETELANQLEFDRKLKADLELIRLTNGRGELASGLMDGEFSSNGNSMLTESLLYDYSGTASMYESVFLSAGFDIANEDSLEVLTMIEASTVRESLISALDNWSRALPEKLADESNPVATASLITRKKLLDLANSVDSSVWRTKLRLALANGQTEKLKQMASDAQAKDQSNELICWLGAALRSEKAVEESISVLRQTQQKSPGDFWLNYELGSSLLATEGRKIEGLGYLRAALGIRPRSTGTLVEMSSHLDDLGMFHQSETTARQALKIDPGFVFAYPNLGTALWKQGQQDEAVQAMRDSIRVDPDFAYGHWALGNLLSKMGEQEEAIDVLRKSIELDPKLAKAHGDLGACLFDFGKHDEALTAFEKRIELAPQVPGTALAHFGEGCIYHVRNEIEKAMEAYERAVDLKPDSPEFYINIANVLTRQKNFDAALIRIQKALNLKPRPRIAAKAYLQLANCLMEKKNINKAIEALRMAIDADPDRAVAHVKLGELLQKTGEVDNAIKAYQQALQSNPSRFEAKVSHSSLASCYYSLGDVKSAIAEFEMTVELDPKSVNDLFNLAMLLGQRDRHEESIAAYRKTIKLNPGSAVLARAWSGIASELRKQNHFVEAIDAHRKSLEFNPDNPAYHIDLAGALLTTDRFKEAAAEYRIALDLGPEATLLPAVYRELGRALCDLGETETGIVEIRKSIELAPGNVRGHALLGLMLIRLGEKNATTEAVSTFDHAIDLSPTPNTLRNEIAHRILVTRNNQGAVFGVAQALEMAQDSCEIAPENPEYRMTLGIARYRNGQWQQAQQALKESADANDDDRIAAETMFYLAMTSWQLKNKDEARDWYAKGVKITEGQTLDLDALHMTEKAQSEAAQLIDEK